MKKFIYLSFILFLNCKEKIELNFSLNDAIVEPKTYVVYKTNDIILIDGKPDENDWKEALFTDDFIDIEGIKIPNQKTYVKMLWDDNFLYIYAKLYEKHIWGDIKKRDAVIFYNNDFEVFINPSNDTHNYAEIEINALNTVWELLLTKPYNVGGKPINSWNLKNLKTAVFIKGSLNNPTDIDDYWAIEMAIPLQDLIVLKNQPKTKPVDKEQWRINFSRVQWKHDIVNNSYLRKKENGTFLREDNWVWSNQKAINMHLPENWGYLQFSTNLPKEKVAFIHKSDAEAEQIVYAIYREIAFGNLKKLKNKETGFFADFKPININKKTLIGSFLKTHTGFTLEIKRSDGNIAYTINESGLIKRIKL